MRIEVYWDGITIDGTPYPGFTVTSVTANAISGVYHYELDVSAAEVSDMRSASLRRGCLPRTAAR